MGTQCAKLLTWDEIAAVDDMSTEVVEVPEWGGAVKVRTLTGEEQERIGVKLAKAKDTSKFNMMIVAASMVGDDGNPLADTPEKLDVLSRKSGHALRRVTAVALRLNGFNVEAVEGNSEGAPTE